MKKWVIVLALFLLLGACQGGPVEEEAPTLTASPTGTATATASAVPTSTLTPTPTPDPLEVLLDRLENELVGEIGFSEDGSLLGYLTETGFFWHDTVSYQQLGYFGFDNEKTISALDYFKFSSDNRYAMAVDFGNNDSYLIDLGSGDEISAFLWVPRSFEFSPDGNYFAYKYNIRWFDEPFLYDIQNLTQNELETIFFEDYRDLYNPAFSNDSSMVSFGTSDGLVHVWDVSTEEILHTFSHPVEVVRVAFSPEGDYLGTLGEDGTVRLWELESETVAEFRGGFGLSFSDLYFGDSWQEVYVQINEDEVIYWDVASGRMEYQTIPPVAHEIIALLEQRLAAVPTPTPTPTQPASTPVPETPPVEYADYPLEELGQFSKGVINSVRWAEDGSSILVSGSQGVYLYNPVTLQERRHVDTGMWMSDALLDDSGRLLSVGTNQAGEIVVWEENQIVNTLLQEDADMPIFGLGGEAVFYLSRKDYHNEFYVWGLNEAEPDLIPGSEWYGSYEGLAMAYSPDGHYLASTQRDGSVWVWDRGTMTVINAVNGVDGEITNFNFSADSNYLIGASGRFVQIWTAELGSDMITIQVFDEVAEEEGLAANIFPDNNIVRAVTAAALSPDGRYVAAGTGERFIMLYDLLEEHAPIKLEGHTNMITDLAFNPEGTKLVSVDADGAIFVWQVPSGSRVGFNLAHSGEIEGLLFRNDGNLAAWSENNIWALSSQDASLLHTTSTYSGTIYAASPDGRYLAVYLPDHMELWSANGEFLRVLEGQAERCFGAGADIYGGFYDAVFSQDSAVLAVDGCRGIWIYSVPSGQLINYIDAGVEFHVALSPDAAYVVTANFGHSDWVSEVETGEHVEFNSDYDGLTLQNRFLPDGSAVGAVITNWDSQKLGSFVLQFLFDDSPNEVLDFPDDFLYSLAFNPEGTLAAVGSGDGEIFFIDLESWQVLGKAPAHNGAVTQLAFSADGSTLASGSTDGTVRLWRMP